MKHVMLILVSIGLLGTLASAQEQGDPQAQKILIAYFSTTNNTRAVAEQIQSRIGGELFRIATREAYPEDYDGLLNVARAQMENDERPELAYVIPAEAMKEYDLIFLGYPIWWGTIPMAVFTFLEQSDLTGKSIVPFCTHGGSGLGRSPSDIARAAAGAKMRQGLAINRHSAGAAQGEIDSWLRNLGYVR